MSTINKLINKMVMVPNDFRETDLDRVMAYFRYEKQMAGGSGIKYICAETGSMINFHHPHTKGRANIIKPCTIKDVINELKREGKLVCSS